MLETARNTRTDGRRDLVTELLGLWLVLAVFLDGWAHLNLPSLETFFTPWHAALYSGMLTTAAWTAAVISRNRTPGQPLTQAIPPGYRGTVAGLVLFAIAGGLDLLWHELVGIEVSLDALVSPTHLLLGFSLFLILGTAVRSARASHSASPDDHPALTPAALFAVVLMTGLGAFFLIYVSAFVRPGPTALFVPTPFGSPGRVQSEMPVVVTLANYLLTTVLIIAPLLFTLFAARHPARGVVTLLVAAAAWMPVAMLGFHTYSIAGAAGATIAAVLADLVLVRLPATWLRRRLPAVTGGIATVLWTGQLVAFAVTDAIRWPVSLWLGAVVLSATVAAGLALLASWGPAALAGSVPPAGSAGSVPDSAAR